MKSNPVADFIYKQLENLSKKRTMPDKYIEMLKTFLESYCNVVETHGENLENSLSVFSTLLDLMEEQVLSPYLFESYHKRILSPINLYQFGLDFLRPLIDFPNSSLQGEENLDEIQSRIQKKENVILFANHQIEADPQMIGLLLQEKYPKLAEEMIFVAGTRVTLDPFAIPFSMGCNLLCIHSKKYIDTPPEKRHEKQMYNKRTLERMVDLLNEGGHVIYVAPSGGRDRINEDGIINVAPFDPQSIELFYLMTKKATRPTHFHTLALSTYHVLPPPKTIEQELGESRITHGGAVHLHFGPKVDMENCHKPKEQNDKHETRRARSDYLWHSVNEHYSKFPK